MANHESPDQILSASDILQFFLNKQRSDSEFLQNLATRLWDSSPLDIRYGIIAVQASLYQGDPQGKEDVARLSLLVPFMVSPEARSYILHEQAELRDLEALLMAPSIQVDELNPDDREDLPPVA
jgi:hypothetical protein